MRIDAPMRAAMVVGVMGERSRDQFLRSVDWSGAWHLHNRTVWPLPSPARATRACPLPGQRLSIFSVFRKAVHANAQLFCSLGAQDRKNRQPLDRERDLKKQGKGERRSQTRVLGSRLSPSGPPQTGQGEGIGTKRQDKQRCRGGPHLLYGFSPVDGATGSGAGATDSGSGTVGPPRDPALDSDDCEIASAICSTPARLEISRIVTMSPRMTAGSPSKTTSFSDALPSASWTAEPRSRSLTSFPLTKI